MENKEENSTALLNASVKVEICWGGINSVIYKRKKKKKCKRENTFKGFSKPQFSAAECDPVDERLGRVLRCSPGWGSLCLCSG